MRCSNVLSRSVLYGLLHGLNLGGRQLVNSERNVTVGGEQHTQKCTYTGTSKTGNLHPRCTVRVIKSRKTRSVGQIPLSLLELMMMTNTWDLGRDASNAPSKFRAQRLCYFWEFVYLMSPITVAALSKVWIVFVCSNAGNVGSNPTQDIDVCVGLFCVCVVLCEGRGLAMGWSLVQGVIPTVRRIKKLKSGEGPKGCRAIEREEREKFNVSHGPFSKIAAPSRGLRKPTKLLLRRRHGLGTCIPGLEGTFDTRILFAYLFA
jgi:hypothetical protein